MSSPLKIRNRSKKEFSRVSAYLGAQIEEVMKRLESLEKRIAKLEAKKTRKRKKKEEKTE